MTLSTRSEVVKYNRIFNAYLICSVVLLGALFIAQKTSAQSIVISDCKGFTRAAHEVEPDSLSRVETNITESNGSPVSEEKVTLTNSVTGEVLSATTVKGWATFENVNPGRFVLNIASPDKRLETVIIGPMGVGTTKAVAAVGVVGLLAGGGGVVVGDLTGVTRITNLRGGGGGDEPAPLPTPGAPRPTPTPTPQPTPTPICDDCDPEARPTPIDDFFGDEANSGCGGRVEPISPIS